MSYASDLISISTTRNTRTPSQAGFGVPLLCGYHTHGTARTKLYSASADMITDGFVAADPLIQMAVALESMSPRVANWKVGRRALPFTQVVWITPASPATGTVYSLEVDGVVATMTAGLYDTLATVCTALASAIHAAAAGVTASGASGTHVICTGAAGVLHSYGAFTTTISAVADKTTDPGIDTDLVAILAADASWYGLLLDSNSAAEITAACTWTEANKKEFVWQNSDSDCVATVVDPLTDTDIFSTTKATGFVRSGGMYYPEIATNWIAAAWMGEEFPKEPGLSTWMWKTLPGITAYDLTTAQRAALDAKDGNYYIPVDANNTITGPGWGASGEWLDVVRDLDWVDAQLAQASMQVFLANAKIAFTDEGISLLLAAVRSVLKDASSPVHPVFASFTVTAPRASDISIANKKLRRLTPGIVWTAVLAGAINGLTVTGVVSP